MDFLKNYLNIFLYLFKMQMNLTTNTVVMSSIFLFFGWWSRNNAHFSFFQKSIPVVRRLLNYESPFLAVKLSGENASLVMRKRYNLFKHLKCFVVVLMLNKLLINLIWYPISCPYWFKVSWLTLFAKEIHAIRRGCVHAIFVYPAYTCKYY